MFDMFLYYFWVTGSPKSIVAWKVDISRSQDAKTGSETF